jgi:hypothetical protein
MREDSIHRAQQIDTTEFSYYTSPMAMGKRKRGRQPTMWVTTTNSATAASRPFHRQVARDLASPWIEQSEPVTRCMASSARAIAKAKATYLAPEVRMSEIPA